MDKINPTNPTLFSIPTENRNRTSDVLRSIAERISSEPVTLHTLTDRLGDRTFGVFLILIAVFNVIPFVSILSGLLVSILGLQMALGSRRVWLPRIILERPLPAGKVKDALLAMLPKVEVIERYIRPRLNFTEAPVADRVNGLVITVLGLIIMIPIPFTNFIPAIIVVFMGIGLSERDGLVQIIAACLGFLLIGLSFYFIFIHQNGLAL